MWREIFKHSGVTLSISQLRVLGDHRGSGYPRIASPSSKFQPETHDLFWFLVRKWFPPVSVSGRRGLCVDPRLFLDRLFP